MVVLDQHCDDLIIIHDRHQNNRFVIPDEQSDDPESPTILVAR